MERRAQFNPEPDDLVLAEVNERGDHTDAAVARARADELVEGFVVGGSAVGVAGAVLLDGADEHLCGAENFRPTDRGGKEVRIAERDVGDGDIGAGAVGLAGLRLRLSVRYGDSGVREGGAADAAEDIGVEDEQVAQRR